MFPSFVSITQLATLRVQNNKPKKSHACQSSRRTFASATQSQTLVRVRENIPAVLVEGEDRCKFVNGMGTNAFTDNFLHPVQTVFTSNIGRCVDLVTAVQMDERVLLLSALAEGQLYQYLDRYIFPADNVEITDISIPKGVDVMLTSLDEIKIPDHLITLPTVFGATIFQRTAIPGCTQDNGNQEQTEWTTTFGAFADEKQWEEQRISAGIPKMGVDITSDNNPLEAGLWSQVSFEKGCYIGQETIARLNTYDGVKQILCLLEFDGKVDVGQKICDPEQGGPVGVVTSVCQFGDKYRAIGYIRKKSGLAQTSSRVVVDNINGVTLDAPHLKQGYENRSLLAL